MNKVEYLDLVDKNDNVIGVLTREDIYHRKLKYVRVIEVFIVNDEAKIWIPIRRLDKVIAPGGFDVGIGGHVGHEETFDEAFRKEVLEEVKWNIDDVIWRRIGKFTPNDGLHTVSVVYEIHSNTAPQLNPEDFITSNWLTPQETADKIKAGHLAKSNLLPLLKLVYNVKT